MLDKQKYSEYLVKKKSSDKLIEERLGLLDRFNAIIEQNGITNIEDIGDAEVVEFVRPWNVSGRRNFLHNIAKFLNDYAAFIKKENPTQKSLADFIESYFKKGFEAAAKSAAARRCAAILPAPAEYKVNPQYLGDMDNDQFVDAFKELQQFVIRCYDDIEHTPFAWGYPEYETTDGYYNRVMDILFAIGLYGTIEEGSIIVDGAKFFSSTLIKRHKKVELMISGFEQMGLCFEGFGKKAQIFRVFYPDNPHVTAVLCAYVSNINTTMAEWAWGMPMNSLSYRYMEDPATQQYHLVFHAEMDYASDELREIQAWLYAEAEKYGYRIDPKEPMGKGCILYKKGSKHFLLVKQGERQPGAGHFDRHETKIGTKVSFIHAFEYAPDKMRAFVNRFPHVFRLDDPGKCCNDNHPEKNPHQFADISEKSGKRCPFVMKFTFDGVTYKRCGLNNFFFEDITFDDVKAILEMFKIENKIGIIP